MIGMNTSPTMSNFFSYACLGSIPSLNGNYISKTLLVGTESNFFEEDFKTSIIKSSWVESHSISDYDKLCTKIMSFAELEHDWDGYDGVPASAEMVGYALELLSEINFDYALPKATLASNGSISFYWDNKTEGTYVEIELDDVGNYNYLSKSSGLVFGKEDISYYDDGLDQELKNSLYSYLKYPLLPNAA